MESVYSEEVPFEVWIHRISTNSYGELQTQRKFLLSIISDVEKKIDEYNCEIILQIRLKYCQTKGVSRHMKSTQMHHNSPVTYNVRNLGGKRINLCG